MGCDKALQKIETEQSQELVETIMSAYAWSYFANEMLVAPLSSNGDRTTIIAPIIKRLVDRYPRYRHIFQSLFVDLQKYLASLSTESRQYASVYTVYANMKINELTKQLDDKDAATVRESMAALKECDARLKACEQHQKQEKKKEEKKETKENIKEEAMRPILPPRPPLQVTRTINPRTSTILHMRTPQPYSLVSADGKKRQQQAEEPFVGTAAATPATTSSSSLYSSGRTRRPSGFAPERQSFPPARVEPPISAPAVSPVATAPGASPAAVPPSVLRTATSTQIPSLERAGTSIRGARKRVTSTAIDITKDPQTLTNKIEPEQRELQAELNAMRRQMAELASRMDSVTRRLRAKRSRGEEEEKTARREAPVVNVKQEDVQTAGFEQPRATGAEPTTKRYRL